ncbi:MAG: 30S ribosomal protein S4 [Patescibacteria group bacterium]|nr:30S ribosomal protein S4 [Patescibacteria group bacterium]MDE1945910.1 30S ribosomal protein S4 [Patescibacteria group bacterium]
MITGKRYKIARRLGPSVFDKTQGKKFALRQDTKAGGKFKRAGSDFGLQLIEKQRAKVTYGVNERQFKTLVQTIIEKRPANLGEALVAALEMRLDNAVYRLGLAATRQAARQMVSHGHIDVNGKRQSIPSARVEVGDTIAVRPGSAKKGVFNGLDERLKETKVPSWLSLDAEKKTAKVQGVPKLAQNELAFDLSQIFQYYSK